jgi:Tfp pilus assembly protein PilV
MRSVETKTNIARFRRRRGLSLIDAVITLVVLAAVTVPIATGIASMARGSTQNYRDASVRSELVYEAERLSALPFASLAIGSTTTSIALPGNASNMVVTISLADYDGDGAVDAEFKLVVLTLEDREIRFFRSDWKV